MKKQHIETQDGEFLTVSEQIDLLNKKIKKELRKSPNKVDMQKIEHYQKLIEELDGGVYKKNEEELESNLMWIKDMAAQTEQVSSLTHVRNNPKKIAIRYAALAAALFIFVFSGFSVLAISKGGYSAAWEYVSLHVKEILNMEPGTKERDGITFIREERTVKYDSLEELLSAENIENVLYPSYLPNSIKIKSVSLIDYDDTNYMISYQFMNNPDNLFFNIKNYYENDLSSLINSQYYSANGLDFYIVDKNNLYQAYVQYNGFEYTILYSNYIELLNILNNLKGIT